MINPKFEMLNTKQYLNSKSEIPKQFRSLVFRIWNLFSISIFVFSISASAAYASSVADLTEIGVGARPLGMARAFTAVADDGSAIFMNPAGLNSVDELSLISMSGNLINEIPYLVIGGARRTHLGVFGIGYIGA